MVDCQANYLNLAWGTMCPRTQTPPEGSEDLGVYIKHGLLTRQQKFFDKDKC